VNAADNTEDNTEDDAEEASHPRVPLRPKRGAIPTPKSEIEKAPVFVPPGVEPAEPPESDASAADTDGENSNES
jgi:hypothetical protein